MEGCGVLSRVDIRSVRFRVSGGFAGLSRGAELNAAELTTAERLALERALGQGDATRTERARDLLTYEFDLDTDLGRRHLVFDELSAPVALADLVRRLAQRARPIPP